MYALRIARRGEEHAWLQLSLRRLQREEDASEKTKEVSSRALSGQAQAVEVAAFRVTSATRSSRQVIRCTGSKGEDKEAWQHSLLISSCEATLAMMALNSWFFQQGTSSDDLWMVFRFFINPLKGRWQHSTRQQPRTDAEFLPSGVGIRLASDSSFHGCWLGLAIARRLFVSATVLPLDDDRRRSRFFRGCECLGIPEG